MKKKILILLIFIIGLLSAGYGIFSTVISKKVEEKKVVEDNEKKEENVVYKKLENETNEEALRRFCLEYSKNEECKTNEIEIHDSFYSILVSYNANYDQTISYDFSSNNFSWGTVLRDDASLDIPRATGGR